MSEILINQPLETVNSLIKMRIGDQGRLLYLKKALTNHKKIYESDKKFLHIMQKKIDAEFAKSQNRFAPRPNTRFGDLNLNRNFEFLERIPKKTYQTEKDLDKKNQVVIENNTDSEIKPILKEMSNSISELKKSQAEMLHELKSLINKYNNNLETNSNLATTIQINKIRDNSTGLYRGEEPLKIYNKTNNNLQTKNIPSPNLKLPNILAWATSGVFITWFVSFFKIIDFNPLQNLLLGLSIGLGFGTALLYHIQKSK